MLLSKVYSHGLLSFVHGVLQNIGALFSDTCSVQVLVAFPCETETPKLCWLASQLAGKHRKRDLPIPAPACTLLCSQDTCSGTQAVKCWTHNYFFGHLSLLCSSQKTMFQEFTLIRHRGRD